MKMRTLTIPILLTIGAWIPEKSLKAVDFQSEVRPILSDRCFKCHSGPRAKGKLRMDENDKFMDRIGGDDPVIIPGDPVKSLLAIKAGLPVSDDEAMPPPASRSRGSDPMTSTELNLVKKWISEGASFEAGGATMTATETTDSQEDTNTIHTWTNTEGNSLEAAFVGRDGTNVKLRKEDGTEFSYPYEKLSAESQELAKKLLTASEG